MSLDNHLLRANKGVIGQLGVLAREKGAKYSWDYGNTWLDQSGSGAGTDDMCISDNGQYSLYVRNAVAGTDAGVVQSCTRNTIN